MEAYIEKIEPSCANQNTLNVYFSGCNFKCPYCNTPEMIVHTPEKLKDMKEIKRLIMEMSQGGKEICFTGGEPTIQREQIIQIATFCKEAKFKTSLETNGSKPDCLNELLRKGLIDTLIVSIKAPKAHELFSKVTRCETFFVNAKAIMQDIKRSLSIIKEHESKIKLVFTTVIVPNLMFRREDLHAIALQLKDFNAPWILKPFKSDKRLIEKKYQGIESPTQEFMFHLREYCLKEHPEMMIEIEE